MLGLRVESEAMQSVIGDVEKASRSGLYGSVDYVSGYWCRSGPPRRSCFLRHDQARLDCPQAVVHGKEGMSRQTASAARKVNLLQ